MEANRNKYLNEYKRNNIKNIKVDVQKEFKEAYDVALKQHGLTTADVIKKIAQAIIDGDKMIIDFIKNKN